MEYSICIMCDILLVLECNEWYRGEARKGTLYFSEPSVLWCLLPLLFRKKGRNVYHFFVLKKSSGEEKKFSSNASYAKQHYSPYWAKNKEVLQKVKVGDQICVTYSLKYAETSLKGEYDPLPNYLIKIEFQR